MLGLKACLAALRFFDAAFLEGTLTEAGSVQRAGQWGGGGEL